MNKNNNIENNSHKKSIWQWLQALIRILQMLAWWNTNKNKRDSRLNTDRADRMDPVLDSTANKDRMDPATTDTCKTSPPREGAGEAAQEMSGEALIVRPVSVISGPVSSTQSSRSQPSSSQASVSKASVTPIDYGPEDILSGSPLKGGRGGLSRFQLLSSLRSESKALARTSDPSPALPREGDGQYVSGGAGRRIDYLVLHCSDTRPDQDFTIEKLKACHKARGFGDYPGYHVYVRRDGSVYYCRPVRLRGCHVKGHNSDSIGICYEGGHAPQGSLHKYEDNRTQAQKEALREVFAVLHDCFPDARIVGHNEFGVPKACPCLSKESMEAFRQEIIHWRE